MHWIIISIMAIQTWRVQSKLSTSLQFAITLSFMAINISLFEPILELLPPEAIIDLAFKTAAALIYESILEWMPPESIMDLTFKTAMALMSHEKIRLVCMKIIILGFMGILLGAGCCCIVELPIKISVTRMRNLGPRRPI